MNFARRVDRGTLAGVRPPAPRSRRIDRGGPRRDRDHVLAGDRLRPRETVAKAAPRLQAVALLLGSPEFQKGNDHDFPTMFLKNGGLALVSLGFAPAFLARTVAAAEARRRVLITIFQRGAVDGLNMIVPFGERDYYAARPTLQLPHPGDEGSAVDLDGFFGLASAARAVEAALRRASNGDRACVRLARRHAFPFRRAGLHGDGDARRQEHARRLAESLPPCESIRRRRRSARSRSRRSCHERCRELEPALAIGQISQFGIRAGQAPATWCSLRSSPICGSRRKRAALDRTRSVRRRQDAEESEPRSIHAGQRRGIPARGVR